MKNAVAFILSAGIFAGCSNYESGRVTHRPDGVRVYGLDDQPASSVTAEGALMPGAFETGNPETGQFTGQERSHARVGQFPVPPREADITEMERDSRSVRQVGTGIVPEWSRDVRMSGSTARSYGTSLTTSSLLAGGGGINPATVPTLSEPLTRRLPSGIYNENSAFGASPAIETGIGAQSLPAGPASTSWWPIDNTQDSTLTAVPNLSDRVRQALTSGRLERLRTVTSDRIEDIEIDALNGNVTLRGNVRSETEKLTLQNKISQVPGVRSVNNQLRVVSPDRKYMDDGTQPAERANILQPEK